MMALTDGPRTFYNLDVVEEREMLPPPFPASARGSVRPGHLCDSIRFVPNGGTMVELPTGTVTFLFTDIEGSTRLWEEHPDAMPAALVRHDEILRTAIDCHGGVVVSEMGDGMAAAFESAAGAVSAALAGQVALRD